MKSSYTRTERVTAEFAIENTGDTAANYIYGGCSPVRGTVSQGGEDVDYYAEEGCTADIKTGQLVPGQRSVFPLNLRRNNATRTNEPGQYKLTGKIYINQKVYGPDPVSFTIRSGD